MTELFLEAESFAEKGGWVTDTASVETIGSAYLMAHGMGIPVADACTSFALAEDGVDTLWALAREWPSCWNAAVAAGRLRL